MVAASGGHPIYLTGTVNGAESGVLCRAAVFMSDAASKGGRLLAFRRSEGRYYGVLCRVRAV